MEPSFLTGSWQANAALSLPRPEVHFASSPRITELVQDSWNCGLHSSRPQFPGGICCHPPHPSLAHALQ